MKKIHLVALSFIFLLGSCAHEEFPIPTIPPAEEQFPSYKNPEYIQINPILNDANGYNFKHPTDIYFGVDNFLYIADTDNNRIVMMDVGGAIQGYSQYIDHPVAISQNDSLQLLIVNNTNAVYKIDLYMNQHMIGDAQVKVVFEESSKPTRQFTGITIHNGFEYYVTVIDTGSGKNESFIYDFRADNWLKGPLPLEVNGSGLFSAMLPTGIVSRREQYLDISSTAEKSPAFLFTQTGYIPELQLQNYYKVQDVTTIKFEGDDILVPNVSLIGTDMYNFEKYYNPEDIALDRSGYVFVVECGPNPSDINNSPYQPGFYRFSPTGKQLQSVLGFGTETNEFNNPKGIAVSPVAENDQVVYIADTGNNRILRFILSTD